MSREPCADRRTLPIKYSNISRAPPNPTRKLILRWKLYRSVLTFYLNCPIRRGREFRSCKRDQIPRSFRWNNKGEKEFSRSRAKLWESRENVEKGWRGNASRNRCWREKINSRETEEFGGAQLWSRVSAETVRIPTKAIIRNRCRYYFPIKFRRMGSINQQ